MEEKVEQEWRNRFKRMKKYLGWSYDEMATSMGASSGDVLKATISRKALAFTKPAVCLFENSEK